LPWDSDDSITCVDSFVSSLRMPPGFIGIKDENMSARPFKTARPSNTERFSKNNIINDFIFMLHIILSFLFLVFYFSYSLKDVS
jgi:hypothetical protein